VSSLDGETCGEPFLFYDAGTCISFLSRIMLISGELVQGVKEAHEEGLLTTDILFFFLSVHSQYFGHGTYSGSRTKRLDISTGFLRANTIITTYEIFHSSQS